MLEDPPLVGNTVNNDDQAVIVNDERVGTSRGFTIGEPMPSDQPPVYYSAYDGGEVPPGTIFMTESIAVASGFTSADTSPDTPSPVTDPSV